MKEIKKYFDNFMKDLKEFSKDMQSEYDNPQLAASASQGDKNETF